MFLMEYFNIVSVKEAKGEKKMKLKFPKFSMNRNLERSSNLTLFFTVTIVQYFEKLIFNLISTYEKNWVFHSLE